MPEKMTHGLTPNEHAEIVKTGYNKIAKEYLRNRDIFENMREIEEFISHVPVGGTVLDIGCGGGVPVLKTMVERGFNAKGIDFSKGMLEFAEINVSQAELIHGDIMKMDFEPESLDGIVSTYAIIHIHKSYHPVLYQKIYNWLKPGGIMLVSTARTEWEELSEYYGVPMTWSHPSPSDSLQMIVNTGFKILFERLVTTGDETHYWILSRK